MADQVQVAWLDADAVLRTAMGNAQQPLGLCLLSWALVWLSDFMYHKLSQDPQTLALGVGRQ